MLNSFAHLIAAAALSGLVWSAPAFAQETTETQTADSQTADTPNTGADAPLPIGDEAQAIAEPGQTYVREIFTDWELRCIKQQPGDREPCQMYQLLRGPQGNAVAEFTMVALPSEGNAIAGATVITPLETLLTEGLAMQIDEGETRAYPYNFCNMLGCFARMGFTPTEVDKMKRGAQARIRIVSSVAPDQDVILTISLKGFTAAYDWLAERLAADIAAAQASDGN